MRPRKIAVIGLGYVGLPVAVAFGAKDPVIGFDVNRNRLHSLSSGRDETGEVSPEELAGANITFTDDESMLSGCDFFIICVPTPINKSKQPDLRPLLAASETVGRHLKRGDIVVFESTVYPGTTEEKCLPILERQSQLRSPADFEVGYSPERINPGDKEHTFSTITKVVAGQTQQGLQVIAKTYREVVKAGIFEATSIKVAEAAKVIENTQRDLNIALMNELAIIFDRMGIKTHDVLEAASTKWNFLPFKPGLVGGHCIGVDPYYLTHKAQKVGYNPELILAGRRINDNMAIFFAQKIIKTMILNGIHVKGSKVGIFGITFKENCVDTRNSKVFDMIDELKSYGIEITAFDPVAAKNEHVKYPLTNINRENVTPLDAFIFAVSHNAFKGQDMADLLNSIDRKTLVFDIKGVLHQSLITNPNIALQGV